MNSKTIDIATEFSKNPYGRDQDDGDYNGLAFRRDYLVPSLKTFDEVIVEMSGTNRYGSSFLQEAFGKLTDDGFTLEELERKLKVNHSLLPSLEESVWLYIKKEI